MNAIHPYEATIMRELHHKDGRPFSFDPSTVRFFQPHQSGEGTLMRFDPIAYPEEVHTQEDYDSVSEEVTGSTVARAFKAFQARDTGEDTF